MFKESTDSGQTYSKHFIPLESSPEIFTELAHNLGLSVLLEFQDVLSLDDADPLALLPRPVYGLILVFPTTEAYEQRVEQEDAKVESFQESKQNDDVVFFKQTINNACGLYAILHAVCNGHARKTIGVIVSSWCGRQKITCPRTRLDYCQSAQLQLDV
jgi:ubiquitin carboxyl-terminal hydrolase L3